ncbi:MAG: TPM domain-containing protein [Candidatus Aenigmarchaeota archaeon]|nr:TPM domain-containing protein [Candidatus Aenigmarchaeota archaeon]
MKYKIVIIFLLLTSVVFAFPQPVGYVNDFANILTDKNSLEQDLSLYEKNTTIQIAIVTIDSLPQDQNIYTYSVELFQAWGIGKKGEDNGILVLIVKNGTTGNRLKIELGYGVQGYITGAESGRILDAALPSYTAGDYQTVAQIIVSGLKDQLQNYQPGVQQNEFTLPSAISMIASNFYIIIFLIIIVSSVASRNRCPYCLKGKIKCEGDYCTCENCGKKFKKKKRYAPIIIAGGFGGGGGGFGGFGGGGSGGGGGGR